MRSILEGCRFRGQDSNLLSKGLLRYSNRSAPLIVENSAKHVCQHIKINWF